MRCVRRELTRVYSSKKGLGGMLVMVCLEANHEGNILTVSSYFISVQ
jgi:hypothetical protein